MNKITSYFASTKNKKYGYDKETQLYHCIECGKPIDPKSDKEKMCGKNKCESKFIFRIK